MAINDINFNELSNEEIMKQMDADRKVIELKENEIRKLKSNEKKINEKIVKKHIIHSTNPQEKKFDEDFEDETAFYLQELNSVKENKAEEIRKVLPVANNYKYKEIIMRLMAETHKTMLDLNELVETEKDYMTKPELEEIKEEILKENKRLEILRESLNIKQSKKKTKKEENNLIFVPTLSGNVRALDELEHIDIEYYDRFYGLFRSIKEGTFKNIKRFQNNLDLTGICEVKDFKVRVVFQRLDDKNYAVITAFIKKSDKDKGYLDQLRNKVTEYKSIENALRNNLSNKEFIGANKDNEEKLFKLIGPQGKRGVK